MDFYKYRRTLPHWRAAGATYFVTYRIHPSRPPLSPEERDIVLDGWHHYADQHYVLGPHVVMDDHVHVLVTPLPRHRLTDIIHSRKSFSANQFLHTCGRSGPMWQDEMFDHIIRDEGDYAEKAQYILNNPRKRWPELEEYRWVAEGYGAERPQ